MACDSCFLNCGDSITSDQCVKYTGSDIPALGICQGDQLSQVEAIIINELIGALEGIGITPEQVTLENCEWLLTQFTGKDFNLSTLLQLLIDSECSLKDMIDQINQKLATTDGLNFNILCLQGLPANPTINDIVQSAVNLLCSLNTTVSQIPITYVKLTDLQNLVNQYISQYNTGSGSTVVQYFNNIPLKTALPYFGDLSAFDNSGKGLESAGMKNIYLANGLNGTPDLRGMSIVGAVRNVPGGTLDPRVDPSSSANTAGNVNYSVGDVFGENFHKNSILEMPVHSHQVIDASHSHTIKRGDSYSGSGNASSGYVGGGLGPNPQPNAVTSSSPTGIALGSTGGGQAHETRQPGTAAYWIIRMV